MIWQKISVGGSQVALQFFHLKMALELLISVKMNPLATFLYHWVEMITPMGKKTKQQKQINTHP